MDEKTYKLKNKATICLLIYISISFILIPILYMTIIKMFFEGNANYTLQSSLNLISYGGMAIAFVVILRSYLKDDLFVGKKNWLINIGIIIALVGLIKASDAILGLIYKACGSSINGDNQDSVIANIKNNAVLMGLSACIFAPIVEEIIFRKCIFAYFDKNVYGIIASTIFFALIHVLSSLDFIHIFPYLVTGALFSVGYALSKRNIYVTIIAHMLVNTISFIVIIAN